MKNTKNNTLLKSSFIYSCALVFVIISSMIPNKENSYLIEPLYTILPGVEKVYNSNEISVNKKYSIKIIERLKKLL